MPRHLQYAFYLASSWLWCIGAFFPLILLRDYGGASLAAFAVFNIFGAAWFGFHFRNGSDQAFRERQRGAIGLFSFATIAYQLFFVAWLSAVLGLALLVPLALALAAAFFFCRRHAAWVAVAVFALSMVLFALYGQQAPALPSLELNPRALHVVLPLALGFLLSPYLDITFHRAFRDSDNPRLSFAVGFGVLFFALLLFVFSYADQLSGVFFGSQPPSAALYPVAAFIVLQTAFTIALHAQEYVAFSGRRPMPVAVALAAFALVTMLAMGRWHDAEWPLPGLTPAELAYKSFLFLYGLVFPLLVLFGARSRRFWVLLVLATPGYVFGFLIGGDYTWTLSLSMAVLAVGLLQYRFARTA